MLGYTQTSGQLMNWGVPGPGPLADDLRQRGPRLHVRRRAAFRHERTRRRPLEPLAAGAPLGRRVRGASLSRLVSKGYVVVTGASTGIGEATARHLAGLGFNVFAGVRKDADAERIAGPRIEPLKIDVTDEASVDAAAAQVTEAAGNTGVAALVNNAGIAVAGPLEFIADRASSSARSTST